VARVHLANRVNGALGYVAVTPWTVGDIPNDDLKDLVGLQEKRQWIAETDAEKISGKGNK
jgi:hypothetical protein